MPPNDPGLSGAAPIQPTPNKWGQLIDQDTAARDTTLDVKPVESPAPQQANKWGQLIDQDLGDQHSNLQAAGYLAAGKDPDQHAKVIDLAKRMGVSPEFADRNFDQLDLQRQREEAAGENLPVTHPGTAQWLQDPNNAAIAKDDIQNLKQIEPPVSFLGNIKNKTGQVISDYENALGSGTWETAANNNTFLYVSGAIQRDQWLKNQAAINQQTKALNDVFRQPSFVANYEKIQAEAHEKGQEASDLTSDALKRLQDGQVLTALKEAASGTGLRIGSILDVVKNAVTNPQASLVYPAVKGLPAFGQIALSGIAGAEGGPPGILAGTVLGFLPGSVAGEFNKFLAQQRDENGKPYDLTNLDDLARATANPEVMDKAFRSVRGWGTLRAATQALILGGAGKYLETLGPEASALSKVTAAGKELTEMSAKLTGAEAVTSAVEDKSLKPLRPEAMAQQMVETMAQFAPFEIGPLAKSLAEKPDSDFQLSHEATIAKAEKMGAIERTKYLQEMSGVAQRAINGAQALEDARSAITMSEVLKRSPDAMNNLLKTINPDGQIWFQTGDWDNYWNSKGESPSKMADKLLGDDGRSYRAAQDAGTDFSVPTSEFLSHFADSEHFDGLAPSAILEENGMKASDAQIFFQKLPASLGVAVKQAKVTPTQKQPPTAGAKILEPIVSSERPDLSVVDQAAKEAEKETPTQVASSTVAAIVKDRLKQSGFSEHEAESNSRIWGNLFAAVSERTGQDPIELLNQTKTNFKIVPPEILKELADRANVNVFKQESIGLLYTPFRDLSPDLRRAETEFATQLSKPDTSGRYAALPDTDGGRILDTDSARELYAPYRESQESRTYWQNATQRPASAWIQGEYERRISLPATGDAVFMAGGGGSGKSTIRRQFSEIASQHADVIYDGVFANLERAERNVDLALKSGRTVRLEFVLTDAEVAAARAAKRFYSEGRDLPARVMAEDHVNALETFLRMADHYKDNPDVKIYAFDNTGTNPHEINLDELRRKSYIKGGETNEQAIDRLAGKLTPILGESAQEANARRVRIADARRAAGTFRDVRPAGSGGGVEGAASSSGPSGSEEHPGESQLEDALKGGKILFQNPPEAEKPPLGAFFFGRDGDVNIYISKGANLSTLAHESSHYFFSILRNIAERESAPEQVKADWQTVKDWLGVSTGDEIQREHQEKWARSFEGYLLEGKAPSAGLKRVFDKFKTWLSAIYSRFQQGVLTSELTPEVRGVFDRLLATDQEIQKARESQGFEPLLKDADLEALGATGNEKKSYQASIAKAVDHSRDEITKEAMKNFRSDRKEFIAGEKAKIKTDVESDYSTRLEFIAQSVLTKGTMPDGKPLPEFMKPVKLDRQLTIDQFGEEAVKLLPKSVFGEGGVSPDLAAHMLHYVSGDSLVHDLSVIYPYDKAVRFETDRRLKEQYPDIYDSGNLPSAVMKAVHNADQAKVMRMELEFLMREEPAAVKTAIRQLTKRLPTDKEVQQRAQDYVADQKVSQVKPSVYERAEAKFGKEAGEAFTKGDRQGAFDAKLKQAFNHELYRAARDIADEVDKITSYMKRFDKATVRDKLAKAGEQYLPQIDSLLDRFDLRKSVSLKDIEKRKALALWVADQHAQGNDVNIPEKLLNEANRQHYKDMTVADLRDLYATIKNIEHLGNLKTKLLANARFKEFQDAKNDLLTSLSENHNLKIEPKDLAPGLSKRLVKSGEKFIAQHTKMEFLFEHLDGGNPLGSAWHNLFEGFANAEDSENSMRRDSAQALRQIFEKYPKSERALWYAKKIYIPEIDTPDAKISPRLTKANILAVGLHMRNEYNAKAVMDGYGWTPDQLDAVLRHLDARDVQTINEIGAHLESYWPKIAELEKRLNGLAPQKVAGTGMDVPGGHIEGGYTPLKFDSELSYRQSQLDEASDVREMFGGQWARAQTRHGHTIERTNTAGKPPILDLGFISDHLSGVIHDLTHREAVIDAYKLISDPDIRTAIEGAAGREMYRELKPWLRSIANDRGGEPPNAVEGLLSRVRNGTTIAYLGWKMTSALKHLPAYLYAANEVGPAYAMKAMRDAYGKPFQIKDTWDFIASRSPMMRDRPENFDRDARDALRSLNVAGVNAGPGSVIDTYTHDMKRSYLTFIGYANTGVAIPTWLAGYRKAMDGKMANISPGDEHAAVQYADNLVRKTLSAGAAKDLAGIQRGSQSWKLFTMFYSQAAVSANQFIRAGRQFKTTRDVPKLLASAAAVWFLQPVLQGFATGHNPSTDESDESWGEYLAKKEILYPLEGFILLRDVAQSLDKAWSHREADFQISPVVGAFDTAVKGSGVVWKPFTEDQEINSGDIRALYDTFGTATGFPTRQTWQSASYFYDWLTGEEDPGSVPEGIYRGLVSGKPYRH